MKEHLTREAGELLDKAGQKASLLGSGSIGPEHIILVIFESGHELAGLIAEEYPGSADKIIVKLSKLIENKRYDSQNTENLLKRAHKYANLSFSSQIDVQHLLLAVFEPVEGEDNTALPVLQSSGIGIEWLLKQIRYPRSVKKEALKPNSFNAVLNTGQKSTDSYGTSSPLDRYGRDLTALAQDRRLDPVALREDEIDDIIEVLCRRVKSNPLLVGEPGVGKSALLVGLAHRIAEGNVPNQLKGIKIFELNLTSIIAGASFQGEFEKRMTGIINHIKKEKNIIVFIDEIHTIVGAGGIPGLGDAANILKAPLISGEIKCIGATTLKEYRKYIERDPALARRFQTVEIKEPTPAETVEIIKSVKHLYEDFHQVVISDEVINKTVEFAVLHIKDQFLPDKAIDLIDQSSAHVSLAGGNRDNSVTIEDIAFVVSHKTKIPLEKIQSDRMDKLLHLEEHLRKKIIGQDQAINKVGDIIRLTKSSLDLKPVRPDGVFLFIGPTGVGKTELARVLAELLFDDEGKMIRLDMSEYMEPHSISKIIGSPPGYIGSDQEGGLTGRVRTEPYSIILLDEVEKAHSDVLNIFLQVFEDGRLTDSQGRTVYFSNCTIIMTSNIGASQAFSRQKSIGFNDNEDTGHKETEKILRESLKKFFSPEFINRIDEIVYFKPLDREAIKSIASLKLNEIRDRFAQKGKEINFSDRVLGLISTKGYNPEYGARFLNRTIEDMVLKPLSKKVLAKSEQRCFKVSINRKNEITVSGKG